MHNGTLRDERSNPERDACTKYVKIVGVGIGTDSNAEQCHTLSRKGWPSRTERSDAQVSSESTCRKARRRRSSRKGRSSSVETGSSLEPERSREEMRW